MPQLRTPRLSGTHAPARPRATAPTWADLGLTPEMLDWHADAACRDTDPDGFYPEPDDPHREATAAAAKRVCATCPVRTVCLEHALTHGERYGIWGGLTASQRRRHYSQRPRTVARSHDHDIARLTRAGHSCEWIAAALDITTRTVTRARARLRTTDTPEQEAA